MYSIYFISDLHLANASSPEFLHLQAWLPTIPAGDQLFILGDFFDAWVGDDAQHRPEMANISQLLRETTDRGVAAFFLHGNRDFLVGEAFCQSVGMTLISAPYLLTIEGQEWLLLHGDELCTDDHAYQQFRSEVRGTVWQQRFLAKPLTERLAIASALREESHRSKTEKNMAIMDVNQQAVVTLLAQYPSANIIHGHTHRPAIHDHDGQSRWVIPDWHGAVWGYLRWQTGTLTMHQFDSPPPSNG